MKGAFGLLGFVCGLVAFAFNVSNAASLWGALGGFLAVVAFPVMFVVVPIVLLTRGEIPVYSLLVPAMGVFIILASKD